MLWSNQTQSARMSIVYITAGALIDVWTVAYYFFVMRPDPASGSGSSWFWVAGFFFTGLALLMIGFFLGQIGRAAAKAEVAPAAVAPVPVNAAIPPAVAAPAISADLRQPAAVAPVQAVGQVA